MKHGGWIEGIDHMTVHGEAHIQNNSAWARTDKGRMTEGLDAVEARVREIVDMEHLSFPGSEPLRVARYHLDAGRVSARAIQEDEDAFNIFTHSRYFRAYDQESSRWAGQAWRSPGHWHYGTRESDDGLWAEEVSVETRPVDRMGRYVLSGLLGSGILKLDARLNREALRIEPEPLRRAIMVGGAAMTVVTNPLHKSRGEHEGARYEFVHSGRYVEAFVGGNLHGDFLSLRLERAEGLVRDSSTQGEVDHYYAPALESQKAYAYHSVEPAITRSLLTYLVGYLKRAPLDVYRECTDAINARGSSTGSRLEVAGPFADYGDDDGSRQASSLVGHLKLLSDGDLEPLRVGSVLGSFIVQPQHDAWLELSIVPEGVRVENTGPSGRRYDGGYTLSPAEIPLFIAALASGRGGRTGSQAIHRVVRALVV